MNEKYYSPTDIIKIEVMFSDGESDSCSQRTVSCVSGVFGVASERIPATGGPHLEIDR